MPQTARDKHIPLCKVSFNSLLSSNEEQISALLQACKTDGCFLLDLKSPVECHATQSVLTIFDKLVNYVEEFYALPLSEKLKWEMDKWGDLQIGG
jgi:isopenicillin N synthase-like dioxygenase